MNKFLFAFLAFFTLNSVDAQIKKDWKKLALDQSQDHLLFQLSSDRWLGAPDSISNRIKGFSRGVNFAVMLNRPFKSDPRLSVAFGIGVSSSSIFFKTMSVDVTSTKASLPFVDLDSTDRFKKYKLATFYAEIPVELRYSSNPVDQKKSWKFAIGAKLGTMLNAHTKGKTLQNRAGTTIGSYTEKLSKRSFFNSTRIVATARIGYGNFSLFGNYQLTGLFKDGAGPDVTPLQMGLCISGL